MNQQVNVSMDVDAMKRSPLLQTKKGPMDGQKDLANESIDSRMTSSLNNAATEFRTPQVNKGGKYTLEGSQQQMTMGMGSKMTAASMSGASPDKNFPSSIRKRSPGGSRRSSRSQSPTKGSCSRHRSRSSLSGDADSQERAFTYPCQAFKQFLLSMNKGNFNMNDLTTSPQLMEYAQYSAEKGRHSDPKPFSSTLRQSDNRSRSNSKTRSNQKINRPSTAIGESSHYGKAKDSIIEEEEEDGGMVNISTSHHRNTSFGANGQTQDKNGTKVDSQQKTINSKIPNSNQQTAHFGADNKKESHSSIRNPANGLSASKLDTKSIKINPRDKRNLSAQGAPPTSDQGSSQRNSISGPVVMSSGYGQAPQQNNTNGSTQGPKHNFKADQSNSKNKADQYKVDSKAKQPIGQGNQQIKDSKSSPMKIVSKPQSANLRSGSNTGTDNEASVYEAQLSMKDGLMDDQFDDTQRFDEKGRVIKNQISLKPAQTNRFEKGKTGFIGQLEDDSPDNKKDQEPKKARDQTTNNPLNKGQNQGTLSNNQQKVDDKRVTKGGSKERGNQPNANTSLEQEMSGSDAQGKSKSRRARKDRSSVGGLYSSYDKEEQAKQNEFSPNGELRPSSGIPKPLNRDNTPHSSLKNLNQSKLGTPNRGQGTIEETESQRSSRIPILDKNNDFSDDDMILSNRESLFQQDQKKKSPNKNKLFKEDQLYDNPYLISEEHGLPIDEQEANNLEDNENKGLKTQADQQMPSIGLGAYSSQKKKQGRGDRKKDLKGKGESNRYAQQQHDEDGQEHPMSSRKNKGLADMIDLTSDNEEQLRDQSFADNKKNTPGSSRVRSGDKSSKVKQSGVSGNNEDDHYDIIPKKVNPITGHPERNRERRGRANRSSSRGGSQERERSNPESHSNAEDQYQHQPLGGNQPSSQLYGDSPNQLRSKVQDNYNKYGNDKAQLYDEENGSNAYPGAERQGKYPIQKQSRTNPSGERNRQNQPVYSTDMPSGSNDLQNQPGSMNKGYSNKPYNQKGQEAQYQDSDIDEDNTAQNLSGSKSRGSPNKQRTAKSPAYYQYDQQQVNSSENEEYLQNQNYGQPLSMKSKSPIKSGRSPVYNKQGQEQNQNSSSDQDGENVQSKQRSGSSTVPNQQRSSRSPGYGQSNNSNNQSAYNNHTDDRQPVSGRSPVKSNRTPAQNHKGQEYLQNEEADLNEGVYRQPGDNSKPYPNKQGNMRSPVYGMYNQEQVQSSDNDDQTQINSYPLSGQNRSPAKSNRTPAYKKQGQEEMQNSGSDYEGDELTQNSPNGGSQSFGYKQGDFRSPTTGKYDQLNPSDVYGQNSKNSQPLSMKTRSPVKSQMAHHQNKQEQDSTQNAVYNMESGDKSSYPREGTNANPSKQMSSKSPVYGQSNADDGNAADYQDQNLDNRYPRQSTNKTLVQSSKAPGYQQQNQGYPQSLDHETIQNQTNGNQPKYSVGGQSPVKSNRALGQVYNGKDGVDSEVIEQPRGNFKGYQENQGRNKSPSYGVVDKQGQPQYSMLNKHQALDNNHPDSMQNQSPTKNTRQSVMDTQGRGQSYGQGQVSNTGYTEPTYGAKGSSSKRGYDMSPVGTGYNQEQPQYYGHQTNEGQAQVQKNQSAAKNNTYASPSKNRVDYQQKSDYEINAEDDVQSLRKSYPADDKNGSPFYKSPENKYRDNSPQGEDQYQRQPQVKYEPMQSTSQRKPRRGRNNRSQDRSLDSDNKATDNGYQREPLIRDVTQNEGEQNAAYRNINQDRPADYVESGKGDSLRTAPSHYQVKSNKPSKSAAGYGNTSSNDPLNQGQNGTNSQGYSVADNVLSNKHDSKYSKGNSKTVVSKESSYEIATKIKLLEDKIKEQILNNPTKPLDHALLAQLQNEIAKTLPEEQKRSLYNGYSNDKATQTDASTSFDPKALFDQPEIQAKLGIQGKQNHHESDKFKRFLQAVFFAYKMMENVVDDHDADKKH